MSWRATAFVKDIKGDSGITRSEKFLLLILADYHNDDTGQCNPSIPRLALDCLMHERTLQRVLDSLNAKGFVQTERRNDDTGRQTSSQQWLICLDNIGGEGGTTPPGGEGGTHATPGWHSYATGEGGTHATGEGGTHATLTVNMNRNLEPSLNRQRGRAARGGRKHNANDEISARAQILRRYRGAS